MINRETLLKKIENLPPYLLEEVDDYIHFIQFKKVKNNNVKIDNITLASQDSLSKDWLKPEEDEAWADL
ncbi:hypothetical protein [Clostridium saccharobutylicum]|uniref:DUF2281 domain-containing protein n=1 Tax=Clostridium saccharobutylicum DSM 13864 TaxID=1345695 RepID=U5MRT3_CLOSA|nr:hypothetical protein [Clostridium saccharobutylicum]AGX43484.1 hypothetical protein CLSA_c25110 [Clostridium saccharobutylicum DSM 13864]AQR90781.1 hypothetical protein CLOSC_25020 [Clostridium saccharobutylicum]AQS00685.1 hypothetical protein CSACC_25090 [Clostridium saccharobutylicum]AQS10344.1 hypothetical protein CLOBY_24870 [Clostridium saccharobutylicum]AQS14668.1 hypothetical protein CLOSACC_25090 [Clostridium saccharobutylicum]